MKRNLRRNKLFAFLMVVVGIVPVVLERDISMLILSLFVVIPLLMAKRNLIVFAEVGGSNKTDN